MDTTVIAIIFVVTAACAMLVQTITEMRRQRSADAYSQVKLNRLLKYRDKAKLLDAYMNSDMSRAELAQKYYAIENKE